MSCPAWCEEFFLRKQGNAGRHIKPSEVEVAPAFRPLSCTGRGSPPSSPVPRRPSPAGTPRFQDQPFSRPQRGACTLGVRCCTTVCSPVQYHRWILASNRLLTPEHHTSDSSSSSSDDDDADDESQRLTPPQLFLRKLSREIKS